MKSPLAIAALIAASLTIGAAVPAFSQDASSSSALPPPPAATDQGNGPMGNHMGPGAKGPHWGRRGGMDGMGRLGMLVLACSDKGSDKLGKVLDRAGKRLQLSDDQQKLFDTFKTQALAAEGTFASTCQSARPQQMAGTPPDMLARMKAGLAIEQARLTALNAVLPDFEALYTSLSDQQKQHLFPHGRHMRPGPDGNGPDQSAPPAPPAPSSQNS